MRAHAVAADQLAVEAVGLVKAYRRVPVLDGVELGVAPGSVFALLGPNGAGKTTIVRILATLLRPDAGQARVAGFDLAEAAGRRVATWSGGMRRRLDLAASLVGRPRVLFLDEPTTGLDPRSRQAVWQVVAGLASSGVTIVLTTQYLEEADRLADRIAVLDGGRVVADGTSEQLKERVAGHRLDLEVDDAAAFAEVARRLEGRAVKPDRGRLPSGWLPMAAPPRCGRCWMRLTRPGGWSTASRCTAPPWTTCSWP